MAWGFASGISVQAAASSAPAAWAKPKLPANWDDAPGGVSNVEPPIALPAIAEDGTLKGYGKGWQVVTYGFQVSKTWTIVFDETPLASAFLDRPTIDVSQISAAGSQQRAYAAVGTAMFAVKVPGRYRISASFERPAASPASCLTRLVFVNRWLLSHVEVNIVGETAMTYDGATFDLKPGLYPINFAFTCWQGMATTGPGRMTLLVQHPGEEALAPARPDDVVRRATIKP
jgi:hypothetical protein